MNLVNFLRWLDDQPLDPYQYRYIMHIWRVGFCFKGVRTIAEDTKISKSKIAQLKKWCLDNAYIEEAKQKGKTGIRINQTIIKMFGDEPLKVSTTRTPTPKSVHHADKVSASRTQSVHLMDHKYTSLSKPIKDREAAVLSLVKFWVKLTADAPNQDKWDQHCEAAIKVLERVSWDAETAERITAQVWREKNKGGHTYTHFLKLVPYIVATAEATAPPPQNTAADQAWDKALKDIIAGRRIDDDKIRRAARPVKRLAQTNISAAKAQFTVNYIS